MFVICHYGEIGLKGKNRKFFEEKLVENIKRTLLRSKGASEGQAPKGDFFESVRRISGRILVETKAGTDQKDIAEKLKNVFGIAYFCFVERCEQDIEAIKKKAAEILKRQNFKTFRISARRSEKSFLLTSQQVNERVGEEILKRLKVKVDLSKSDVTLFVEIVEKCAFLYTEKIRGLGGLPVGASGKGMVLISGGIDSPLAGFYAMKRGIETVFAHFHAVPYVAIASIEKVKKTVEILKKYQSDSMVYIVPFSNIQKEILLKTKADLRVVLYRRFMLRIAEVLAKKEKASVLITGESVGQVASQTLPNLSVIDKAVDMLVLRPLIGFDKQEIIEQAQEIGTYEISILPHDDCCARFLPKHPETKANFREVEREEAKLEVDKLIKETVQRSEKILI